jgi:hypothetical protein
LHFAVLLAAEHCRSQPYAVLSSALGRASRVLQMRSGS